VVFDRAELDGAVEVVRRWVPPTPQYRWPLLCEQVGAEVLVKHENHTPVGSFKVRGGLVYAHSLKTHRPEVGGLVSATRGNHGQSLAFAGARHGLSVTIVVPEGNSPDKNASMRAWEAELIVHGEDYQEAREHAQGLATERNLEAVPSFHRDLVVGVATYALELFQADGALDTVYVPVGMGSGICAVIGVRDLLGLATEVVGVVTKEAPATALSVAAGHVVATDTADTFVDGVACRVPEPEAIGIIASGAARVIQISEDEAAEAMRVLFRATHNLAEPAGALSLAGLLQERDRAAGTRVGVIHSGGNADADLLLEVMQGRTPSARVHRPVA
jgi:threonine dehydratase